MVAGAILWIARQKDAEADFRHGRGVVGGIAPVLRGRTPMETVSVEARHG